MPKFEELRGILIDRPEGKRRVTIISRGERGDDYTVLHFPPDKPLNRGQVKKVIADHFGIPPGQVKWPPHVKVPGEKKDELANT